MTAGKTRGQWWAMLAVGALLLMGATVVVTLSLVGRASDQRDPDEGASIASPSAPPPTSDAPKFGPTPVAENQYGGLRPGLSVAVDECSNFHPKSAFAIVSLSDDQRVLIVDGFSAALIEAGISQSLGGPGDELIAVRCIAEPLNAPSGTVERMAVTRALDGVQSAQWAGYEVTWTYHPDSGLDAVFSYSN